jgi:hypothetical protein
MYETAKTLIKKSFHIIGLKVTKRSNTSYETSNLPIIDHPLEALCNEKAGRRVAFWCDLEDLADIRGHGYTTEKWHPFVETLREYKLGKCSSYEKSILKKYYRIHKPKSAADAYPGFENAPDAFHDYPPHRYRLLPWSTETPCDVDNRVRYWTRKDNEEHGHPNLTLSSDGNKSHGPVSTEKGRMEFERLTSVFDNINDKGYDTRLGYPHLRIIKRDNEYLLNPVRGKHRTAAMAALGYKKIPAMCYRPSAVDTSIVKYWPQVRKNVWKKDEAISYVNYLFKFKSREWAKERGLTL